MNPVFLTDRDLGAKKFPGVLRDAGLTVERHIDYFPHDAPDERWLSFVAEREWYALSNDRGILRKPVERDFVVGAGVPLFVLVGGHAPMEHLAYNFVNTFPRVRQFISKHEPPFIAKVYRPSPVRLVAEGEPGRVELKYPV